MDINKNYQLPLKVYAIEFYSKKVKKQHQVEKKPNRRKYTQFFMPA